MPLDEVTLRTQLQEELLETATLLGWSDPSGAAYSLAIRRALRRLDLADVASASDTRQLELLATVEIWSAVCKALVGAINFEADGGRYDREKLYAHAQAQLAQAEKEYAQLYPPAIAPDPWVSGVVATSGRWE